MNSRGKRNRRSKNQPSTNARKKTRPVRLKKTVLKRTRRPEQKELPKKTAAPQVAALPFSQRPKLARRPLPAPLPPELLESGKGSRDWPSGPGRRLALPPVAAFKEEQPPAIEHEFRRESDKLFLAARDPRCLYAAWGFSAADRERYGRLSKDGRLVLRLYQEHANGPFWSETSLPAEASSMFIEGAKPDQRYVAQLGIYTQEGAWLSIFESELAATPPESPSVASEVKFATLTETHPIQVSEPTEPGPVPAHAPAEQPISAMERDSAPEAQPTGVIRPDEHPVQRPVISVVGIEQSAASSAERTTIEMRPSISVAHAPAPRGEGQETTGGPSFPRAEIAEDRARKFQTGVSPRLIPANPVIWPAEKIAALANLAQKPDQQQVWIDSLEIAELVSGRLKEEAGSMAAAELAGPRPGLEAAPSVIPNVSSPSLPAPKRRGFWFSVNAELVIYGATETDAEVRIGGRAIRLRPDGTFSFRFALPDGEFQLPITAEAADGEETREADLSFRRKTRLRGRVDHHPQDAVLKPPASANV